MRAIILFITGTVLFFSCDNQLSKEQRKALKEEMEHREIKKISSEDIYKKALEEGAATLIKLKDNKNMEQVEKDCRCQIKFNSSADGLSEKSKAIFLAYTYDPSGEDNIQKENETLIYSKPQIDNDTLSGVWFVTFLKKDIAQKL